MPKKRTKAPGRNERIKISLKQLFDMFPDDQAARKWFEDTRWKNGRFCPNCGSVETIHIPKEKPLPYYCRVCRRHFSVKSGTVMHRSKVSLRDWAIGIYLLSTSLKGVSSMKLYNDLEYTQKTTWQLAHKIREGWERGKLKLSGIVEVDESYFGGRERNKHANKKLRAGRGTVGKQAVLGIKERGGQIRTMHVKSTDASTLQRQLYKHVELGAIVCTDEHKSYIGIDRFFKHKAVKHSAGEFVDGMAHVNGIESHWAMMKRGYHGTYHRMSPKHLQRYVDEFQGRHDVRGMDTIEQMETMVKNFDGKRLTYKQLTEDPEKNPQQ